MLQEHGQQPHSYAEVGCTGWLQEEHAAEPACGVGGRLHRQLSRRYTIDRYRLQLGSGEATYRRACRAIQQWRMLDIGWLRPCWTQAVCQLGEIQGTVMRFGGLWSVNLCRLVDVHEYVGDQRRFSVAQGTLPGHVEVGEERFTLEWDQRDDSVWFEILAVSRPGHPLARLGYPVARRFQRRFGRDSLQAMSRAVGANDESLLVVT
jgi:uncharacterized protein (UPF0548 family)